MSVATKERGRDECIKITTGNRGEETRSEYSVFTEKDQKHRRQGESGRWTSGNPNKAEMTNDAISRPANTCNCFTLNMKIKYLLVLEFLLALCIDQLTSTSPVGVVDDRTSGSASRRKLTMHGERALWKTNGASIEECNGLLQVYTGGKRCKKKAMKSTKREKVKNTL